MSDFKAKMHLIRFPLGDPAGGAYSAPPGPLAVFKGLFLRGRRGRRKGGKGKGGLAPVGESGSAIGNMNYSG